MDKKLKSMLLWFALAIILLIPSVLGVTQYHLNYNLNYNDKFTIYNSSNYKTTTLINSTTIPFMYSFATNKDNGQYILIAGATSNIDGNYTLYTSNDYGLTFNKKITFDPLFAGTLGIGSINNDISVTMSNDGKFQYFTTINNIGASGQIIIYKSSDYGNTFTSTTYSFAGLNLMPNIVTTSTGEYVVIILGSNTLNGKIIVSNDYGTTYTYATYTGLQYYSAGEIYLKNDFLETVKYQLNLTSGVQQNYSIATDLTATGYYDGYTTIIINLDCSGFKLIGNASAGTYTPITDLGNNCLAFTSTLNYDNSYISTLNSGTYRSNNVIDYNFNNWNNYSQMSTVLSQPQISEYTNEYIDICIAGNILCHHLYVNSSGVFCSITNQISCPISCSDNSSYWESISSSPIDLNYSGYCSFNYNGLEMCDNINDTRCGLNNTVETCIKDSFGNNKWYKTFTCINTATCSYGQCYLPGETIVPPTNTKCIGFDCWSVETKYYLMLGICLFILIVFTILMASFGDATAGLLVGLVFSMIVSLTLSILWNLSLLIPILYIVIGGAICAVIMRYIFTK